MRVMGYLWIIAGLFILAPIFHVGVPWVVKLVSRRRFLARVKRSRCCCITFDDGPDPRSTPRILEILSRHGARGTFFLLGRNAEKHPELADAIARGGHEIGLHGYGHSFAWTSGPLRSWSDAARCDDVLRRRGIEVRLYRPPFGKLNLATLVWAWRTGKTLAWWSTDPKDYGEGGGNTPSGKEIAERVAGRTLAGSVLLLHDGRIDESRDPGNTVAALEGILELLERKGIETATVSECLGRKGISGS